MPANATDTLSLARCKLALRLTGSTEHDALLTGYIDAAARFVDDYTGLGVVNTTMRARLTVRDPAGQVFMRSNAITVADPEAVENADGALATAVAITVMTPALGGIWLHAPAGGWPVTAPGSWIDITYNREALASQVPAPVIAAMELIVRDLYDGRETISPNWAVRRLLEPHTPTFAANERRA